MGASCRIKLNSNDNTLKNLQPKGKREEAYRSREFQVGRDQHLPSRDLKAINGTRNSSHCDGNINFADCFYSLSPKERLKMKAAKETLERMWLYVFRSLEDRVEERKKKERREAQKIS